MKRKIDQPPEPEGREENLVGEEPARRLEGVPWDGCQVLHSEYAWVLEPCSPEILLPLHSDLHGTHRLFTMQDVIPFSVPITINVRNPP